MAVIPTLEDDACGRATALRQIRDSFLTGGGVAEIETEGANGSRRRVKYSAADRAALDREISIAEAACKGGSRPRQFAFGGRY